MAEVGTNEEKRVRMAEELATLLPVKAKAWFKVFDYKVIPHGANNIGLELAI